MQVFIKIFFNYFSNCRIPYICTIEKPAGCRFTPCGLKMIVTMAKVRYSLQTPKQPESLIRMVFRFSPHKLVFYPGYKIRSADWNGKEMRLRKGAPNAAEINAGLARLAAEAERLYLDSKGRGELLTLHRFREMLFEFWHGKQPEPEAPALDLVGYLGRYIQEKKDAGRKYNLTKGFGTLLSYLEEYREKRRLREIPLDSVDLEFHAAFVAFLTQSRRLAPNTVHKALNRLKTVMSEAFDRGYTKNNAWRSKRFTAEKEPTDAIYLTEHEIAAIAALDLSGRPAYERCRDSFLLGAYTGLRYSDFSDIRPGNINKLDGVTILKKRQVKTKRVVAIPLFAPALAILAKYDNAPPVVNNQVMNRRIKHIARQAGVSGVFQKSSQTGDFSAVLNVERWRMVTTHTARRSFATNEYLRAVREGRDWRQVMDITGHSTEAQFFEYVKVRSDVRALGFAKARG